MKRRSRILPLAVVALACALPVSIHAASPPCVLYVSPSGNDAWSGKLATANAAKADGPLASLVAARDAIRKLKAAGPQVHGALISHNHVHDTTRWGISAGHTTSTNNIVEYNHLHDLNTETYDTGGLEVTQQSRDHRSGSIFRYNLIHDTGGYSSMMGRDMWNSWGIYLDSFAGGFTVHGNVVYGASDGGLMIQGGKLNKVYNNIFVENGPRRQILISNFSDNSRGTEFHHNIVSYAAPEAMAIYCGRQVARSVASSPPPRPSSWGSSRLT